MGIILKMILIRVGMVFILCGVLVGLLFSEWSPILPIGILLLVAESVRRVIGNHGNKNDRRPDAIILMRPKQEEL